MMQQSSSLSSSLEESESDRSWASSARALYLWKTYLHRKTLLKFYYLSNRATYLFLSVVLFNLKFAFLSLKVANLALAASLRSSFSSYTSVTWISSNCTNFLTNIAPTMKQSSSKAIFVLVSPPINLSLISSMLHVSDGGRAIIIKIN